MQLNDTLKVQILHKKHFIVLPISAHVLDMEFVS